MTNSKLNNCATPFSYSHISNVDFNYLKLPEQVFQDKLNGGDNEGRGVSPALGIDRLARPVLPPNRPLVLVFNDFLANNES